MVRKKQKNNKKFFETDKAILMVCIGIAFVFWLLTKLSYTYKSSLIVRLDYILPENKVLTLPPAQQLNIDIEGVGWDLLSLLFSNKHQLLTIDARKEDDLKISAASLKSKVMSFVGNTRIRNIAPESIQIQIENSATKKIPIVLDAQIALAPLYQLESNIKITPKIVEITGPASVIKGIKEWHTNSLILQNIKKTIQQRITLKKHTNSNVKFSVKEVDCIAEVEEVTEKQIDVPVEVLHVPDSLLLVVLPKKIKVYCNVGLSDYARLVAKEFKFIIDFEEVDLSKQEKIKVMLRNKPNYIQNVHYKPQKVDFIIRKN